MLVMCIIVSNKISIDLKSLIFKLTQNNLINISIKIKQLNLFQSTGKKKIIKMSENSIF